MYRENTGKTDQDFLVRKTFLFFSNKYNFIQKLKNLSFEIFTQRRIEMLDDFDLSTMIITKDSTPIRRSFHETLKVSLQQIKELVGPNHLKKTVIMSLVGYCVTLSYFTLLFWLPEIFQRFEIFDKNYPGKSASICTVSNILYSRNSTVVIIKINITKLKTK